MGRRDHMYAFSSKSGSEPFRALGDLTWNDRDTIANTLMKLYHTACFPKSHYRPEYVKALAH